MWYFDTSSGDRYISRDLFTETTGGMEWLSRTVWHATDHWTEYEPFSWPIPASSHATKRPDEFEVSEELMEYLEDMKIKK